MQRFHANAPTIVGALVFASLMLTGMAGFLVVSAHGNGTGGYSHPYYGPPVAVDSSPVAATPEATPGGDDRLLGITTLPGTGAGTTAHNPRQSNCCMWTGSNHYEVDYICDGGHWDKVTFYVTAYGSAYLVSRIHYVSWSCWASYG